MERLVVQSTSLNALWLEGRGSPDVSSFDPMSRVKELKIVPGGQYLVATRKFRIRKGVAKWAVFVYRMEGVYGPTPLMYVDTGTRAFHLDAKFVTVDGVSVLAIAYVKREWLDPSQVPKECVHQFYVFVVQLKSSLGNGRSSPSSTQIMISTSSFLSSTDAASRMCHWRPSKVGPDDV